MDLYRLEGQTVQALKDVPFKLEKDMQALFETHLPQLMGWQVVKSEFRLKQFRFDTLAFDAEKQAFVVIEYKRDKNHSVVDQGVAYLNAMLEYKDSLLMEYNERFTGRLLKRSDVDWSQTRMLFVANAFTPFQKQATNFKDLGIALAEFKRYENGLLSVNLIERDSHAPELPKPQMETDATVVSALEHVAKEIVVYDEAYHLDGKSDAIVELYEQFRDALLNLDAAIQLDYTKLYVAFKKDKSNCVDIAVLKNSLKLWVNARWGSLNDARGLFRDVSAVGHHGNGDYQVHVSNSDDLEYILSVVKQVL